MKVWYESQQKGNQHCPKNENKTKRKKNESEHKKTPSYIEQNKKAFILSSNGQILMLVNDTIIMFANDQLPIFVNDIKNNQRHFSALYEEPISKRA